jgi:hypothetical protein
MVEINHVIETAIEREIVARPAGRALALDRLEAAPGTALGPFASRLAQGLDREGDHARAMLAIVLVSGNLQAALDR